jgi:hypothetical protein
MEWSKINGWEPGLYLDRIDNYKGYNPKNCRWVTNEVSLSNKRIYIKVDEKDYKDSVKDGSRKAIKAFLIRNGLAKLVNFVK